MDLNNINPEKVENAINKYLRIKNIVSGILIAIIFIIIAVSFYKDFKQSKNQTTNEEEQTPKVTLTASEEIVWNLFVEEGKKVGFIDADNLDSIDIVSIEDYGKYKKSEPDLRYEQINFIYTCIEPEYNCVNVAPKAEGKDYHSQIVTIDLRDKTYIDIGSISFGMGEPMEDVTEPFTYYELEK